MRERERESRMERGEGDGCTSASARRSAGDNIRHTHGALIILQLTMHASMKADPTLQ